MENFEEKNFDDISKKFEAKFRRKIFRKQSLRTNLGEKNFRNKNLEAKRCFKINFGRGRVNITTSHNLN